jgi:SAM-dependent methyltransferase
MGRMPSMQADISARVRAQYEAFPYPHYGLFMPLRLQEAYASHSLFAARLLEQQGRIPALRRRPAARVLLAGCGDTFPYLAAFWEPRRHGLAAVDLSARNLRRARMRCLPHMRGISWRQGNLEDPGFAMPGGLAHIDCYGVLHHLAEPARVLRRFGESLLPGGTARIMVYNSAARRWIHHLQRAFALLGLSAFEGRDRERGQRLLDKLASVSPAMRERFAPMRGGAFADASRFVDTFMHAREARLDAGFWLRAIADSGLQAIGLFDRYAELDDLRNPLLEAPSLDAMRDRIVDRRFENNLELYLAKPGQAGGEPDRITGRAAPGTRFLMAPPLAWFGYPETRSLPWLARRRLWAHFLRGLAGRNPGSLDAVAGSLPPGALQRLARIGALFPDDFRSAELKDLLRRPLHDSMEPPDFPAPGPVRDDRGIRAEVLAILGEKGLSGAYLEPVMLRLHAAQKP